MPCDRALKPRQTIQQRAEEIRKATDRITQLLVSGTAKVKVGPQGAVAFVGIPDDVRDGLTDACAYRRIMVSGSASAKAAIARAELLAGRQVDRLLIGQGVHSHDGGKTWHGHK